MYFAFEQRELLFRRDTMQLRKSMGAKAPISAPNTPEALRRGLRDKKEKMEYNQMMMRSLTERGESRPLSYHGRSGSVCLDTQNPTVVNKRHIVSSGSKNKKDSVINRRSMPIPYLENRLRDKMGMINSLKIKNITKLSLLALDLFRRT